MQVQLTRQSGMAPPLEFWRCAVVTFPFLAPKFWPKADDYWFGHPVRGQMLGSRAGVESFEKRVVF